MAYNELVCGQSAKLLDQALIKKFNLTEKELVDRAGRAVFEVISNEFPTRKKLDIVCGPGKNGADGFQVARHAKKEGYSVRVYAFRSDYPESSLQFHIQKELKKQDVPIFDIDKYVVCDTSVIVDGIFGVGLNRKLSAATKSLIKNINDTPAVTVAIDVPTGVDSSSGWIYDVAVKADLTVSFFAVKQGSLTGAGKSHSGKIVVDNLLLDVDDELKKVTSSKLLGFEESLDFLPSRREYSNKHDYGHNLVIGGAPGYAGAPLISCKAALRSGSGLVSLATHFSNSEGLISGQPEIMFHKIKRIKDLEGLVSRASVIGIGPGLGLSDWSKRMYQEIQNLKKPVVFDADALNILARNRSYNNNRVLTPHAKEAARLLGVSESKIESDRFLSVAKIVETYGGVCLLKGPGTIVAGMGRIPRIISGGHSGMATGGMGDLLLGIILSFMGQGLNNFDAACLGCSIHNQAADRARISGLKGMLPTDLLPIIRGLIG